VAQLLNIIAIYEEGAAAEIRRVREEFCLPADRQSV
jgi:hypothetical protein